MKRLLPVLSVFVLILSGFQITSADDSADAFFSDSDWTVPFHPSSTLPRGSARWIKDGETRFLRFKLENGQKGNNSRDRMSRGNAPYWERVELESGSGKDARYFLRTDGSYLIELRIRFVEGFTNDLESVFQFYNSCGAGIRCMPPFMLRSSAVDSYGNPYNKLQIEILSGDKQIPALLYNKDSGFFDPAQNLGKWVLVRFKVSVGSDRLIIKTELETANEKWFTRVLTADRFNKGYSATFLKFGLYRPGNEDIPNKTSIIDVDYIKVVEKNSKQWTYCLNPDGENNSSDLTLIWGKCQSGHEPISSERYKRLQTTPFCWSENEKKAYKNINFCEGNDKALTRLRYRSLMSQKESSNTKPAPEIRTNYCYISELNTLTKTTGPYCANGMMVTLDEGQELVKKGRKR